MLTHTTDRFLRALIDDATTGDFLTALLEQRRLRVELQAEHTRSAQAATAPPTTETRGAQDAA